MRPDSETTPASIARQLPRHDGLDANHSHSLGGPAGSPTAVGGDGRRRPDKVVEGVAPGADSDAGPSEAVLTRGRLMPVALPAVALYQWLALGVMELGCHGVMVDGASTANPYALVMAAKARGLSVEEVTSRVHVVRGFTAHQLERLCTHDLPELALELGAQGQRLGLVWLSGLGLFAGDDQLQPLEGEALRGRSLKAVHRLVTQNWAFGIVTAAAGRGYGHTGSAGPGTTYRIEFTQEECKVGRSLPSYRNQLEHTLSRWQAYRRALSPRERPFFDRVEAMARGHAAQGAYLGSVDPIEPVLLAVLVEQEKRLEALEGRRTLESHEVLRTDDGALTEPTLGGSGADPVRSQATTGEKVSGNRS